MSKTNKELAVELYCAFLQASGTISASTKFSGSVKLPTVDEMVNIIKDMEQKLSAIKD